MNTLRRTMFSGLLLLATGCSSQDQAAAPTTESAISSWPEKARTVAQATIREYGPPDEATPTMLQWIARAPWKRIIVHRDEVPHEFPLHHVDVLEQVIDYSVPSTMLAELASFDGSLCFLRTTGELSVRGAEESWNFLSLNLAVDILTAKSDSATARQTFADTVAKAATGEKGPYMEKLQFASSPAQDPDTALAPTQSEPPPEQPADVPPESP